MTLMVSSTASTMNVPITLSATEDTLEMTSCAKQSRLNSPNSPLPSNPLLLTGQLSTWEEPLSVTSTATVVPEMVTTNRYSRKIFILNGNNTAGVNTIQNQITVGYNPAWEDIAIANLNNDNCGEIFVISTGWRLYSYDCNLVELWNIQLPGDPGTVGIADFNGDGQVELYARNAIYNAHTGAVIVAATWSVGRNQRWTCSCRYP